MTLPDFGQYYPHIVGSITLLIVPATARWVRAGFKSIVTNSELDKKLDEQSEVIYKKINGTYVRSAELRELKRDYDRLVDRVESLAEKLDAQTEQTLRLHQENKAKLDHFAQLGIWPGHGRSIP